MTDIKNPRYGIEVILQLSRYKPAIGNKRINTKTNKYKEYSILIHILQFYFVHSCSVS